MVNRRGVGAGGSLHTGAYIYIYIYMVTPPPQGLPFYFLMKDIYLQMFSVHLVCRCLAENTVIYGGFVHFLILSQMCFLYLMQNRIRESNKHENGQRFQMQLCQC